MSSSSSFRINNSVVNFVVQACLLHSILIGGTAVLRHRFAICTNAQKPINQLTGGSMIWSTGTVSIMIHSLVDTLSRILPMREYRTRTVVTRRGINVLYYCRMIPLRTFLCCTLREVFPDWDNQARLCLSVSATSGTAFHSETAGFQHQNTRDERTSERTAPGKGI